MEVLHPRCCGIDVHKASAVACLRLQQGARAKTEIQKFGTTTGELLRLHAWLAEAGCTHVAMESTSVYWKPVFNLLEGSFEVVLANAYHIKAVPGRKTDVNDCEWIADLLAHGLIRASFIPPAAIRELRDLTRHRKSLIRDRVKAANRVHKVLETANIKLGNVVTDVLGVSGRAMLDALVRGETDPASLAKLARGSLIPKQKLLAEALQGGFTAHHAFLLGQILTQLDQLAELVAACDARIAQVVQPHDGLIQFLQTIPGVGRRSAEVIVSRGQRRTHAGRTSAHSTAESPSDADPSAQPSRWPTASWSSLSTSCATEWSSRIWARTTSTGSIPPGRSATTCGGSQRWASISRRSCRRPPRNRGHRT